jgi:hypothetical protein
MGRAMAGSTKEEYLKLFEGGSRIADALKVAHDIRKFEIELYWKRAAYFWTFIAVAFAGFFASTAQSDLSNSFIIACLGFLFSLAWYLVNRGSSAWQRNWEVHVDLLEDSVTGPLHKAIVSRGDFDFKDLLGPYSYSPSRLNTAMSLLLIIVWAALGCRTIVRVVAHSSGLASVTIFGLLTLAATFVLLFFTLSGTSKDVRSIDITVRRYD